MIDTKQKTTSPSRSSSSGTTHRVRGVPKPDLVLIDVSPDPVPTKPGSWDEIQLGSLVLAWDRETEGWFEALVINIIDGTYRLKWRDYTGYKPFVRRREQLALLYPGQEMPQAA